MKMRFYYHPNLNAKGQQMLWRTALFASDGDPGFNKYLGGMLQIDFQSVKSCESVLEEISRLELNQIKSSSWSGNAFDANFDKNIVHIEHTKFADHDDWPDWKCATTQLKEALIGWKRFLELPQTVNSEVTVVVATSS